MRTAEEKNKTGDRDRVYVEGVFEFLSAGGKKDFTGVRLSKGLKKIKK